MQEACGDQSGGGNPSFMRLPRFSRKALPQRASDDTSQISHAELRHVYKGGSARIVRCSDIGAGAGRHGESGMDS